MGAGGGDTYSSVREGVGGRGAEVEALLPVTPGEQLNIVAGGRGGDSNLIGQLAAFNGGGARDDRAGGGGGASDVRGSTGTLESRLLVAGGGGGAGYSDAQNHAGSENGAAGDGGASGAAGADGGTGTLAEFAAFGGDGGSPGTADAGGTGGHSGIFFFSDLAQGGAGTFGTGGDTAPLPPIGSQPVIAAGGAGGGGWYGGGAGGYGAAAVAACICAVEGGGGGGGGGSSHISADATGGSVQDGVNSGNGYVTITYTPGDSTPVDTTAPTVSINQAATQADPTENGPIVFDVVFSEPVTGFDSTDVSVTGTAGATSATVTGSGTTYTATVAKPATAGTVIGTVAAGVAQDAAGNASEASTSTDNTVTFTIAPPPDTTAPSVTINQAGDQADPTSTPSARFAVVFSEPVTGFTGTDVTPGGTAPGTKSAAVTGSGTTYVVTVSGATGSGTLTASIPAGVASDAAGNTNLASTSTDNTVTYTAPPPPDTVAPLISCTASPSISTKPPNHTLLSVTVTVNASDPGGSGVAGVRLVSVTSSQADSGLGKDDVANDRQGWSTGTDDRSGFVRAERYKTDRVYTMTYRATDNAGNTATCATTVKVTLGAKPKKPKGK
ncbi:MAG: Ig-like domain-containing protein [Marmoricola sp.]